MGKPMNEPIRYAVVGLGRSGWNIHVEQLRGRSDAKIVAVVDPRLKVHGLEGLRVIDASIFPDNITGNTNAASIMTGWKGAELRHYQALGSTADEIWTLPDGRHDGSEERRHSPRHPM